MNKCRFARKTGIILLVLIIAFAFASCGNQKKSEGDGQNTESKDTETVQVADEEAMATILVASDYQQESGWPAPAETLTGIIDVAENDGKDIDEAIFCGDYSNVSGLYNHQISPDEAIDEIKGIVEEDSEAEAEDMIFVQGNHDRLTESISKSGLHEFDDYFVYVINTEEDFPWTQGNTSGSLDKVKETAAEMKECFDKLINEGETRPIFIAGHVPLHFSGRTSSLHSTGDNLYSGLLFEVVNEAAKSLNITYLFGHNHSKGWDSYLGNSCVFRTAGDSILIPDYSDGDTRTDSFVEKKLNFTYMNAGYLGYCVNNVPDDTLTATVCEIYIDRIEFTRYSAEGEHQLGSEGCANSYRDDSGLIPTQYYSRQIDSPQIIER